MYQLLNQISSVFNTVAYCYRANDIIEWVTIPVLTVESFFITVNMHVFIQLTQ